jgi:hypothetical protein
MYPFHTKADLTVVDNGVVSTKEELLGPDTFALVQYDKALREGKCPLFLLSNWEMRGEQDLLLPEYVWAFGDVQSQIRGRKTGLFLEKTLRKPSP